MTDLNMTDQHPITPPQELVSDWLLAPEFYDGKTKVNMVTITVNRLQYIATQAARWGADQELEACCEWLQDPDLDVDTYKLRADRRPKPPSLKEQALAALKRQSTRSIPSLVATEDCDTIRRALEVLPND
jgi:hypothetical protein